MLTFSSGLSNSNRSNPRTRQATANSRLEFFRNPYEQEYEDINLFSKSYNSNSNTADENNVWVLRTDTNSTIERERSKQAIPVIKPSRNSSRISNYQHQMPLNDLWQPQNGLLMSKVEQHHEKPTKVKKNVHYAPFLNQG
jgi:hypothetical protein